jgi:hypothetical protein
MPYRFTDLSIQQINKDGTTLGPALTFTPSTTPANISRFAIGNRVRLTVTMESFGAETWTNKLLRLNLSLFGPTNVTGNPNFGFQTDGFVTGSAVAAVNRLGSDGFEGTRQNISATFQNIGNDVIVVVDFYMTFDIGEYLSNTWIAENRDRFLIARRNFNNIELQNPGSSVYTVLSTLGISCRVFDAGSTDQQVLNPSSGGFPFWDIKFSARWYNADYLGDTTNRRFLESINITSPSQVTNGLPSLANATASSAQTPPESSVDNSFTINRNQLSPSEKNTVTMVFNGFSSGVPTVSTVTDTRVLVIRTDSFLNTTDFVSNYDMSEAIIPASAPGTAQLDGAIYTPASWTQDGVTGEIVVVFDIDGNELDQGAEYRIITNFYETVNADRNTSHISPPLLANYTPPIVPTIDGYLGTYSQEYNNNELDNAAPHQRIRSRLEIDKTAYNAALSAAGLTGSFDDSLFEVSAQFVAIVPTTPSVFERYKPNTLTPPASNTIISNNMVIVTDDASTFSIAAIFRIEEGRAGTTSTIRWTVKLRQPTLTPGVFQQYDIQFDQLLNVNDFENDSGTPRLVGIRFLDLDTYPTTKTDLLNICDTDQFICELEKDPALLTGSNNIIATIYDANIDGETTPQRIEEEESWTPATAIMPQLSAGKLDSVETSFGGDEFATWRINGQQLITGVRYWVTGIAFDQFPDYCPIGLVQNTQMETFYFSNPVSGWTVIANKSLVTTEITSDPNYVGGITTVYQRIVDSVGTIVGYPTSVGDIFRAVRIDPTLGSVFVEWRIDAQFDAGSGPHTVSHTFRFEVPIPPIDSGSVFYNDNTYTCTDLG